jgi:hypothetical protein
MNESPRKQDRDRMLAFGQNGGIVDSPDTVRIVGSLVAEAAEISVDAHVLVLRLRHVVQHVGFPVQIDVHHFEIVQGTEILLQPQPDLENGGPGHCEKRRPFEQVKRSQHDVALLSIRANAHQQMADGIYRDREYR